MNITTTITRTAKGYTVNHGELTYNLNAGWTHVNTYSSGGWNPENRTSDLPVISRHKSAAAAAKAAEADRATYIQTIDLEAATAEPAEVVPGAGCGKGSDGHPCSPAYLCPSCIDVLLAQEAADIAADEARRADELAYVRRTYGDQAAELLANGWTVDSAIAHVTGTCNLEVCGGDHGTDWAVLVAGVVNGPEAKVAALEAELARANQVVADTQAKLAEALAELPEPEATEAELGAAITKVLHAPETLAKIQARMDAKAEARRQWPATAAEVDARNATTPRPRCYMEFCCNVATVDVVVADRSATQDREPIAWGWCTQHVPAARCAACGGPHYLAEHR